MQEIDSPWLRLYPDIGNLAAAGYSPPQELLLAKNHVLGIHVKDAMPQVIRGIPYGKGIVPFRKAFRVLAETGFWGLLSVEMWGHMHPEQDPFETARETCQFIEKLVDEAWPGKQPSF
jgi:L-ribulose-5-phosphate 3-epimerase UlaE